MKKYPLVKQHSAEDCGAACLASITKYYQRNISISKCRELIGTNKQGTTLLGLNQGAVKLGFNCRAVRVSLDKINNNLVPLPAIIHWQGYHWVVLYGKKGKKYVVADPKVGIRYLDQTSLTLGWTNGVMLLLEPDAIRFYNQTNEFEPVSNFNQFWQRVVPYKGIIAQVLLFNVFLGVLSLVLPFFMQILTDDVLIRGDTQLLSRVALAVGIMYLISNIMKFAQSNLIAHFSQRLQLSFIFEFGRQILSLPLTYYESRRSGEVISRLEDIQEINQLLSQIVIELPSQFFVAIISLCLMLFYSIKLTMLATLIAVLMTISVIIFMPTLQQKIRNTLVLSAENQGVLVENFKGAITIKTNNAAPQLWDEFQSRYTRLANLTLRTLQISIINGVFANLVSSIGGIVLLWFGSNLVIQGKLTIGMLLAFNIMNRNFSSFVGTIVSFIDELSRVKTAVQRLGEVINTSPEETEKIEKSWVSIPDKVDLTFEQVNFHHAGRIDLLEDFSLTIPGGKTTALIGRSGCGKSTLAKIIAGLYSPQSGNIRFGIYNQQDLSLACLREQVILVPQDANFWSRSIIDNFRLGNPNITFEAIVRACRITGADDFIAKLPDKYLTILGEFGCNLSGGQKQRLALARAMVKNPPVLILDESTGALDPVSEQEILKSVLTHRLGKTTIIISHRPSVIRQADWMVMLESGSLSAQGSVETFSAMTGNHTPFLTL